MHHPIHVCVLNALFLSPHFSPLSFSLYVYFSLSLSLFHSLISPSLSVSHLMCAFTLVCVCVQSLLSFWQGYSNEHLCIHAYYTHSRTHTKHTPMLSRSQTYSLQNWFS